VVLPITNALGEERNAMAAGLSSAVDCLASGADVAKSALGCFVRNPELTKKTRQNPTSIGGFAA
jgi:hypothetical protein